MFLVCFGTFFDVLGWFWTVSDFGFGPGNNPRRQVFEVTGVWRLHYMFRRLQLL